MTNEIPEVDPSEPVPRRRGPRPVATQNSATLGIVVVAIAVVAGFFILRAIGDDVDSGAITPETTEVVEETPLETSTTTTTEPPLVFEGAIVQVANANGIDGSAGLMSRTLEAAGFTMADAANAATSVGRLDTSVIYYNATAPGALPVAETLARSLGGDVSIAPMPEVPPTADGTVRGEVLLMLGNDKANKTLEELAPAADAVPAPEVAGDATTSGGETSTSAAGGAGTGDDG